MRNFFISCVLYSYMTVGGDANRIKMISGLRGSQESPLSFSAFIFYSLKYSKMAETYWNSRVRVSETGPSLLFSNPSTTALLTSVSLSLYQSLGPLLSQSRVTSRTRERLAYHLQDSSSHHFLFTQSTSSFWSRSRSLLDQWSYLNPYAHDIRWWSSTSSSASTELLTTLTDDMSLLESEDVHFNQ